MGVIANHGHFSRGVAISSFTGNIIAYEMVHISEEDLESKNDQTSYWG
jgi:glycine/D-amino acid oxidase-like deaminating enzyme